MFVSGFILIFDKIIVSYTDMETLILNNSSKRDVKLLVDIAKKLGMDLKVADQRDLILTEALRLNQSVKKNKIAFSEIVAESTAVRKERYQDVDENHP